MVGGISGCSGILLYDTQKKDYNAVYGYYDKNNNIILEKGSLDELKKRQKETDKPFQNDEKNETKTVFGLFFAMVFAVIVLFLFAPLTIAFGALVFCIVGYFPLIVIIFANSNHYKDEATKMQFRRFHGCEHALINFYGKNKKQEPTMDSLNETSIYHRECGTAYCGYALFLGLILAFLIIHIASLGFFKAFGILILMLFLLILNLFNPWNPFVLLQKPAIAKPTEKEYLLGIEIAKAIWYGDKETTDERE